MYIKYKFGNMFKGDDEMKKLLVLIIGILLGNVGMLLWIILSNSLIELDPNKVVIYSGLLGFSGAIVAVFGTYYISMNQLKKQLNNEKIIRNEELEIKWLKELIQIFNELRFYCVKISRELPQESHSKREIDFFEYYYKDVNIKEINELDKKLLSYMHIMMNYEKEITNTVIDLDNWVAINLQRLIGEMAIQAFEGNKTDAQKKILEIQKISEEWNSFLIGKLNKKTRNRGE